MIRSALTLLMLLAMVLVGGAGAAPPPPFQQPRPPAGVNGGNPPLQVQLGRALFFDTTLSNPEGMGCISCHAPEAGFAFPNSRVNATLGTAPGVVAGRFGNRKTPSISYTWLTLRGPTFYDRREQAWAGGWFWDGRARDLVQQVRGPLLNPNEMDNLVHNIASPALVVAKVVNGRYSSLFKQTFGADAFSHPDEQVIQMISRAITAYERSPEVSPFDSKYDAYEDSRAQLTSAELNGLRLFTGSKTGRPNGEPYYKNARCMSCHELRSNFDDRRDLFTNASFANLGIPRNSNNPYYKQTSPSSNPAGYNAVGSAYVDLGLGGVLYDRENLPPGNEGPNGDLRGDFLLANGAFKTPTLRNVDKRPYTSFVKAYMHNGVFKSLKDVVHFLNTRNLTTVRGEVINFANVHPYEGLKGKPVWPAPEYGSARTLENPKGLPNSAMARVGNLQLSDQEENDIVAFLQTLSDGYFGRRF